MDASVSSPERRWPLRSLACDRNFCVSDLFSLQDEAPPRKRQRTSEDFISFCKFILEYENYESIKQEELREKAASPSDSSADSVDSLKQHADVSDGDAARGRSFFSPHFVMSLNDKPRRIEDATVYAGLSASRHADR